MGEIVILTCRQIRLIQTLQSGFQAQGDGEGFPPQDSAAKGTKLNLSGLSQVKISNDLKVVISHMVQILNGI